MVVVNCKEYRLSLSLWLYYLVPKSLLWTHGWWSPPRAPYERKGHVSCAQLSTGHITDPQILFPPHLPALGSSQGAKVHSSEDKSRRSWGTPRSQVRRRLEAQWNSNRHKPDSMGKSLGLGLSSQQPRASGWVEMDTRSLDYSPGVC